MARCVIGASVLFLLVASAAAAAAAAPTTTAAAVATTNHRRRLLQPHITSMDAMDAPLLDEEAAADYGVARRRRLLQPHVASMNAPLLLVADEEAADAADGARRRLLQPRAMNAPLVATEELERAPNMRAAPMGPRASFQSVGAGRATPTAPWVTGPATRGLKQAAGGSSSWRRLLRQQR